MAIQSQAQLDAFKNVALQQGYDPKEVESFMGLATAANQSKQAAADAAAAKEMAMYEQKLKLQNQYNPGSASAFTNGVYDPNKDETFQRAIAMEKWKQQNGGSNSGDLTEAQNQAIKEGIATLEPDGKGGFKVVTKQKEQDPLQWAADNQAVKYLTGKDAATRQAQAAAMQKLGIEGYFKASALPDLLTDKENAAREAATSLLNSASSIFSQVQNQNGGVADIEGIGPLGRFRPGFLTNTAGKTLKQDITNLTAAKMKEISGAAISDREVARLSQALPQVGDTEGVIMTKAKNIADSVEIGLQMQEIAKRERLTLDQAYKQYGAQAFQDKGQPVPSWIAGGSVKPGLNDVGSSSGTKVGRFNIQVE